MILFCLDNLSIAEYVSIGASAQTGRLSEKVVRLNVRRPSLKFVTQVQSCSFCKTEHNFLNLEFKCKKIASSFENLAIIRYFTDIFKNHRPS